MEWRPSETSSSFVGSPNYAGPRPGIGVQCTPNDPRARHTPYPDEMNVRQSYTGPSHDSRSSSRSVSPTPFHDSRRGHRRRREEDWNRRRHRSRSRERRRPRSRDRKRRRSRDRRLRSRSREDRRRRESRTSNRHRSNNSRKRPLCPEFTEHMRCTFGNSCWYVHNQDLARLVRSGRDAEKRVQKKDVEKKKDVEERVALEIDVEEKKKIESEEKIDSDETESEEENVIKIVENERRRSEDDVEEQYEEVAFYEEYTRRMSVKIRDVNIEDRDWVTTRKRKWRALRRLNRYITLRKNMLENKRRCAASPKNETTEEWLSLRKTKWRLICEENVLLAEMKAEVELNTISDIEEEEEEEEIEFDLDHAPANRGDDSSAHERSRSDNVRKRRRSENDDGVTPARAKCGDDSSTHKRSRSGVLMDGDTKSERNRKQRIPRGDNDTPENLRSLKDSRSLAATVLSTGKTVTNSI